MSSKVNSSRRISSASSRVGLGERVEHVALGRAVGAVEDVGQRLDAAGGRELLRRRRWRASGAGRARCRATTSGLVSPIVAMRSATSACSSGSSCDEHLGGERRVQVGDDQRDGLRRLVAQEDGDLLGRRAAQELERARARSWRRGGPMISSARSAPSELLEHLAGEVDAALGERRPRRGRSRRPRSMTARAGLGRRPAAASAISSESASTSRSPRCLRTRRRARRRGDEQDGGLLAAAQAGRAATAGGPAPRGARCARGRAWPARSFRSSLIQARSCWATRSGCVLDEAVDACGVRLGRARRPRRRAPASALVVRSSSASGRGRLDLASATSARRGPRARAGAGARVMKKRKSSAPRPSPTHLAGRAGRRHGQAGRAGGGRGLGEGDLLCGDACRRAWG